MKKIILALFIAILAFSAHAQSFRLGVKLGANYSGFSGKESEAHRIQHAWGAHGGLMANYSFSDDGFFSIQPELLYTMKGAQSIVETTNASGKKDEETEWDLHYIDIPVLARVNAGFLYFEVGPQVSALLKGTVESNTTGVEDESFEKELKNMSFGYAAGVGISSSSTGLSIGVRYTGDITRLYDASSKPDYRNSVFMMSVGYMFGAKN